MINYYYYYYYYYYHYYYYFFYHAILATLELEAHNKLWVTKVRGLPAISLPWPCFRVRNRHDQARRAVLLPSRRRVNFADFLC